MVCIPPQKLAKSQKYKKSNKIDKKENFEKIKKLGLDYVLKNIPAKFGDDQSILRERKLGMMNLTDLTAAVILSPPRLMLVSDLMLLQ